MWQSSLAYQDQEGRMLLQVGARPPTQIVYLVCTDFRTDCLIIIDNVMTKSAITMGNSRNRDE